MIKRYGICDCYGLESYESEENDVLRIRAMANRHRHAVYFIADVSKAVDTKIKDCINKEDFVTALNILKKEGKISFPSEDVEAFEASWKLIPNKELDPWKSMISRKR